MTTKKPTSNQETSISEIDSNQKKYYTTEEAIEFLEPRIREMFKKNAAIRDGEKNWYQ